jgi:hypothetical protein
MAIIHSNGSTNVTITDIQTTSGREINYVKTSSGTYIWTRPTTIDLQFPWDAFSSWALTRMAGSKYPGVAQGPVWYNGSKATSGTNTYSFSNVYYGDKLKFSYTAKPGAIIDQENNYEFTVDPTFSISNIQAEKSDLPELTLALSSQWDFEAGDWSTVKDTSNRAEFTLKVTKPTELKNTNVDIYIQTKGSSAYYRDNWNLKTHTEDTVGIRHGDTSISWTEYTKIGNIASGTLEKNFTLKVVDSDVNYIWPKYASLYVKMELASTDHYYTLSYKQGIVSKGTAGSGSSGGGGMAPGSQSGPMFPAMSGGGTGQPS